MFIVASFTGAKRWKEPPCPSADDRVNDVRAVTPPQKGMKCMNLENSVPTEISQKRKVTL